MKNATALITHLNEMATTLGSHPKLVRVGSGELTKIEWRAFAVERYLTSMIFESLLEIAIAKATEAGDVAVAKALTDNQNNELGVQADGTTDTEMSHAAWRRDFYDALGITDVMLNRRVGSPSVKSYISIVRSIIATDEYLVMSGALLALERFFPIEFDMMKKGRDTVFTDVFMDQSTDDDATKATRARARLYLDDHIDHDANTHYPDLLAALQPHANNEADMARVIAGINAVENAKRAFYDALAV